MPVRSLRARCRDLRKKKKNRTQTRVGSVISVEIIPLPRCRQQGSCICNLNLKNSMWRKAPARLPYKTRGSRGDVTSVCLVVTWCMSSQVFLKDGRFWSSSFLREVWCPTSPLIHTRSFFPSFSTLVPSCTRALTLHQPLAEGAEGAAGNARTDGWMDG